MSKVLVTKSLLDNLNDSISSATGDTKNRTLVEMASDIPSAGGLVEKSANFYDYDGTLVAAYSKTEIDAMTALPDNPSHEGLTAQGWNWTLAEIKSYLTSYPSAVITIGQMYVTTSGATQIDVEFDDENYLSPYLYFAPNGTVEIDWGDGSSIDTVTGTSNTTNKYTQHIYSSTGKYTIKLTVISGKFTFYCSSSFGGVLTFNSTNSNLLQNKKYCSSIIKIRMGNNALIGINAFSYCINLSSITISSTSATSIGQGAFTYCLNLKNVTFPFGMKMLGGSNVLYNCPSLTSVAIPSGTTYIIAGAIGSCRNLKSIVFPSGTTQVNSLTNCSNLQNINIPNTVKELNGTFYNLQNLKNITIPNEVTTFKGGLFTSCLNLKKDITIPTGTTHISQNMFANCYNIKKITFASPSTVVGIGNSAFSGCYNLSEIIIPSGTTAIGTSAFQNCYSLEKITIPGTVSTIGTYAFAQCYSMKEFHIQATAPPGVGSTNTFNAVQTAGSTFYVPTASVDTYKADSIFSTWADQIVGE